MSALHFCCGSCHLIAVVFFFFLLSYLHSHHLIFYEDIENVSEEKYPFPIDGILFA